MDNYVSVIFSTRKVKKSILDHVVAAVGIPLNENKVNYGIFESKNKNLVLKVEIPRELSESESDTFADTLSTKLIKLGYKDFDIEVSINNPKITEAAFPMPGLDAIIAKYAKTGMTLADVASMESEAAAHKIQDAPKDSNFLVKGFTKLNKLLSSKSHRVIYTLAHAAEKLGLPGLYNARGSFVYMKEESDYGGRDGGEEGGPSAAGSATLTDMLILARKGLVPPAKIEKLQKSWAYAMDPNKKGRYRPEIDKQVKEIVAAQAAGEQTEVKPWVNPDTKAKPWVNPDEKSADEKSADDEEKEYYPPGGYDKDGNWTFDHKDSGVDDNNPYKDMDENARRELFDKTINRLMKLLDQFGPKPSRALPKTVMASVKKELYTSLMLFEKAPHVDEEIHKLVKVLQNLRPFFTGTNVDFIDSKIKEAKPFYDRHQARLDQPSGPPGDSATDDETKADDAIEKTPGAEEYAELDTFAQSGKGGLANDPNEIGAILALQKWLKANGFDPQERHEGHYGPGTRTAVRKFQKKNGLTIDGDAGPNTIGKMLNKKYDVSKIEPDKKERKVRLQDVKQYIKFNYYGKTYYAKIKKNKDNEFEIYASKKGEKLLDVVTKSRTPNLYNILDAEAQRWSRVNIDDEGQTPGDSATVDTDTTDTTDTTKPGDSATDDETSADDTETPDEKIDAAEDATIAQALTDSMKFDWTQPWEGATQEDEMWDALDRVKSPAQWRRIEKLYRSAHPGKLDPEDGSSLLVKDLRDELSDDDLDTLNAKLVKFGVPLSGSAEEKPAAEKPAAEKPAAEKPAAEKPADATADAEFESAKEKFDELLEAAFLRNGEEKDRKKARGDLAILSRVKKELRDAKTVDDLEALAKKYEAVLKPPKNTGDTTDTTKPDAGKGEGRKDQEGTSSEQPTEPKKPDAGKGEGRKDQEGTSSEQPSEPKKPADSEEKDGGTDELPDEDAKKIADGFQKATEWSFKQGGTHEAKFLELLNGIKTPAEYKKVDDALKNHPDNDDGYSIEEYAKDEMGWKDLERYVFPELRRLNIPHSLKDSGDYLRLQADLGKGYWRKYIEPHYTADGNFPKPKKESVEVKESSKESFGRDYWNKHVKPKYAEEDKLKVQWRNSVTERVFDKISSKQK